MSMETLGISVLEHLFAWTDFYSEYNWSERGLCIVTMDRSWKGEGSFLSMPHAGALCTVGQAVPCTIHGAPFTSSSMRMAPTRTVY